MAQMPEIKAINAEIKNDFLYGTSDPPEDRLMDVFYAIKTSFFQ